MNIITPTHIIIITIVISIAIVSAKEESASTSTCFAGHCTADRSSSSKRSQKVKSTPSLKLKMQSTSSSYLSSIMDDANTNNSYGEFNLQKARLMARFSSVAYEDPPRNSAKRGGNIMAGVEQFVDSYGVAITRPIANANADNNNNNNNKGLAGSNGGVQNQNEWEMSHVDAMSPRPLMAMFSDCDVSGMAGSSFARSEFQWEALATNKKTSTQFDVWRITTPKSEENENKSKSKSDTPSNILVVAFRGTRLSSYLELYTNIQLKQDMISCVDFGVCSSMDDDDANQEVMTGNCADLMVHSGFIKAYSSIRESLLQMLSENAGTYDHIWFTGHSLGAALATLAVVDVGSVIMNESSSLPSASSTETKFKLPKEVKISSYLFGTPRVGNSEFTNRLARLQQQQQQPGLSSTVQEYYRINTPGDAVPFLPRGKVANRLDIDYVHAGASVFLPTLSSKKNEKDKNNDEKDIIDDSLDGKSNDVSPDEQRKMKESYSEWMMQLEEGTIEQINERIFQTDGSTASKSTTSNSNNEILSKLRIYPKGDKPPDPLSEVDPDYSGFFPTDPRTWIASKSFRNFLLGETVRSFRILRGGFVKNHQLKTYEDGLCVSSQDEVVVINPVS